MQAKKCGFFFNQKILLTLILSGNLFFSGFSQNNHYFSSAATAEKIYLQLDNHVYTNDQTIWFKSIVTDAIDFAPTNLSGVLYAELVDANEKIIEKKLIKIENGIGNGFFQLNKNYAEGLYLVRAYTQWQKNFGSDFFFKRYIQVFAANGTPKIAAITSMTLLQQQNDQQSLTASFNPVTIDILRNKDLVIFLICDQKKDSLFLKKNEYLINYAIPEGTKKITVQLQNQNKGIASRTIILEKDYTDLQFFPESGQLVNGMPGKLGFKATDINGNGKIVEGDIINAKAEVITSFKSNKLGMGYVLLPGMADSTQQYRARLQPTAANGTQKLYTIPQAAGKGNILSVKKSGNKIQVIGNSNLNDLLNDSIMIRVSCRGRVYFDIKGKLKAGKLRYDFADSSLPAGIINFTMMNGRQQPLAERLYFNDRPQSRINISIAADKPFSYTQRELTSLTFTTNNSAGKPIAANLSLAVINQTQTGDIAGSGQQLLAYFLLSADLKGTIENASYYFNTDSSRSDDLEALMLTQGWSRYLYSKEQNNMMIYQPEPVLSVSGTVKGGLFAQNKKKQIGLTMMSFGPTGSVQTQTSDSLGRFDFNINSEYGQSMNIVIQSNNKSGVKKDYGITLNKKESPAVFFDQLQQVAEEPDSIILAYVKKNVERKKIEDAAQIAAEGVTLKEVIVKSSALTPERKKVTDKYGKPTIVIDGKAIKEKEVKWSYGLYSVLLYNFPGKIKIIRDDEGNLRATLYNNEITLVVIDGIPVQAYDYHMIQNIPPSEVSSFEVIEYAKNFASLFCEVYPLLCAKRPVWGNVIAIYTHGKKGLYGANRPIGILNTTVPVFASPREFYAPKYDQLTAADWSKPDLRSLIHWQPGISTDSTGQATAKFYNADTEGRIQVLVEAITETGQMGYQLFYYNVKKKE